MASSSTRRRGGGRHKHLGWEGYESYPLDKGRTGALCLGCNKVFANTAVERMTSHRIRCQEMKAVGSVIQSDTDEEEGAQCVRHVVPILPRSAPREGVGRRKHSGWDGFWACTLESGKRGAVCLTCNNVLANTGIERMTNHRMKCEGKDPTTNYEAEYGDDEGNFQGTDDTLQELTSPVAPPQKLGRPKHSGWEGFEPYLSENGRKLALCLGCNTVMTNTSNKRMTDHRITCRKRSGTEEEGATGNGSFDSPSGPKLGRRLHIGWEGYEPCTLENGRRGALCLTCNRTVANTSLGRLTEHRIKCAQPEATKKQIRAEVVEQTSSYEAEPYLTVEVPERTSPPPKKKLKKGNLIDSAHLKQESLTLKCANYFYKCNIPFSVVEEAPFLEMIKGLCPTFKAPTRKDLGDTLLDECYHKTVQDSKQRISHTESGVIILYGWKDAAANLRQIIAVLQTSDEHILLKSFNIPPHGDEDLTPISADVVSKAIDLAADLYRVTVKVIVTDNSKNMICVGEEMGHRVQSIRCNAQIAYLVLKDIWEMFGYDEVIIQILPILREFAKQSVLARELSIKDYDAKETKLPSGVQICYYRDLMSTYVDNISIYKRMIGDGATVLDCDLIQVIFDDGILKKCKDASDNLKQPCDLFRSCQRKDTTLGEAIELWSILVKDCKDSKVADILKTRIRESDVFSSVALCANILDPRFRGLNLKSEQKLEAVDLLLEPLDAEEVDALSDYLNSKARFESMIKKNLNRNTFWQMAALEPRNRSLAATAKLYTNIPASITELERMFSDYGDIENDAGKNGFGSEATERLVYLYYSSKINANLDEEVGEDPFFD